MQNAQGRDALGGLIGIERLVHTDEQSDGEGDQRQSKHTRHDRAGERWLRVDSFRIAQRPAVISSSL
jgi:hypothetical protein